MDFCHHGFIREQKKPNKLIDGTVIFWQTRYDAFGNVVGGATPWYGYLGKYERYTDETAHLIQMGVRDYDPATGRFTSADPLKGPATDPQQRNRYQYVGNDPLTRYDLSGLFSLSDVKNGLEDFGNDTLGLAGDYLTGGGAALASDWWAGFSSMSTKGKIAIIALPAVPIAAAAGASIAGVGGAVLWGGETLMAEAPEAVDLLEKGGPECGVGAVDLVAPQAENPKLQNIINNIYKGLSNPDRIGDGTTMDAIRREFQTGEPTHGIFHDIKAQETINGLSDWLVKNPNASEHDKLVARSLLYELSDAVNGR